MGQSWQLQFRAIFTGIVLADRVAAQPSLAGLPTAAPTANTLSSLSWQRLLIQTARAICQGHLPDWPSQVPGGLPRLQAAEAELPLLLSLSALPLMLLNLDGPVQGRTALAVWAEQQGLQPQTQALMQAVFRLLQRGMRVSAVGGNGAVNSPDADSALAWLTLPAEQRPADVPPGGLLDRLLDPSGAGQRSAWEDLAHSLAIAGQAQGQYELAVRLALQLARQQPERFREVPLVGLWAVVAGGLAAVPLGWRLRGLYGAPSAPPETMPDWEGMQERDLWQLADGLFSRWMGVSPSLISTAASVYPVDQVGSRLNRAN